MRQFFFILFASVLLAGCIKPPTYPIEPQIEFKSVSSTYLKSGFGDTITISFTDGDGDIGVTPTPGEACDLCSFKNGDTACLYMNGFNVFVIDRDSCVNTLASADIKTSGTYNSVSGEIDIIVAVDSRKCFNPPMAGCPLDTAYYYIVIRDKAGHLSNFVRTPDIIVDGE